MMETADCEVEYKPLLFAAESENCLGGVESTNNNVNQSQTIMTETIERTKKVYSQQTSYRRLIEKEQTCSDTNIRHCKKQYYRYPCIILFIVLLIIISFLLGFYLNQRLHRRSMEFLPICINTSSAFTSMNISIANYSYAAFQIHVVIPSNYSFSMENHVGIHVFVYNGSFHPSNPSINLLVADKNHSANESFKLTVFLQPWISYMLIVTTFSPDPPSGLSVVACGSTRIAFRHIRIPPLQRTIYSSKWTTDSEVYCRDRCLSPEYEYDFDKDFYYKAILINVTKADYFTIMSQSNVNTYGYLYRNSFDPFDTSLNLLMEDDDSGDNEQFKLMAFLRPSHTYILIVTTFFPYVTGEFSIIASGTSSINLVCVSSSPRTTIQTTTLPMVQSNYNGILNTHSPMYCPNNCYSFDHYYDAVAISVDQVGNYKFRSRSDFNACGSIYSDSFDPSSPSTNLFAHNDNISENMEFNLIVTLDPETIYILVVTSYSAHEMGNFEIIASGPASIELVRIVNPSTGSNTTTRQINTIPSSVQSTYSSAWTIESKSYCRTSTCQMLSHYYYEAIQVHVDTLGIFSLISKSNVDTYGYLYNNSFDSLSSSSNLLLQDDEGGNNGQFKLIFSFEPDLIYILVITTFYPNVTGSFFISASGPGSVTFSHV